MVNDTHTRRRRPHSIANHLSFMSIKQLCEIPMESPLLGALNTDEADMFYS